MFKTSTKAVTVVRSSIFTHKALLKTSSQIDILRSRFHHTMSQEKRSVPLSPNPKNNNTKRSYRSGSRYKKPNGNRKGNAQKRNENVDEVSEIPNIPPSHHHQTNEFQELESTLEVIDLTNNGNPETIELTNEENNTQPLKPQNLKKKRVYDYEKLNKVILSTSVKPLLKPSLPEIVPLVDHSLIDMAFLDKISRSRFNGLVKYLELLNKSRHTHPRLQDDNVFQDFEKKLFQVNSQKNILFSIDIEAFERNKHLITEIGISIYDPLKDASSLLPNILNIHILVKEYLHLRNGNFVNDNKDNFLGGSSIILPLTEAMRFVQTLVDHYFITRQSKGMNGVLVGHALDGDVNWLKSIGVSFPENVQVADTQKLYTLADTLNRSSLGFILQRLNIPHSHLHNGGNDAYFTLVLLMKLADPNFRTFHNLDSWKSALTYKDLYEERKKQGVPGRSEKKARGKGHVVSEFIVNSNFDNFQQALLSIYNK